MFAVLVQRKSLCLACSYPRFNPGRVEIFNFSGIGIRRDAGVELQSLVCASKLCRISSKSLRSAFMMKRYVLLIVICRLDGNDKPGSPFGAF
jgi:hypothetical protein